MLLSFTIPIIALAIQAAGNVNDATAHRYAEDYAAVSATLDEAFALAATARVEGVFDPRVETCARTGDHGRSISMFQLRRFWWEGFSRDEICKSNRLASLLALHTLRRLGFERAPYEAFRRYVGCRARDARVAFRVRLFVRLRRDFALEDVVS